MGGVIVPGATGQREMAHLACDGEIEAILILGKRDYFDLGETYLKDEGIGKACHHHGRTLRHQRQPRRHTIQAWPQARSVARAPC